MNRLGNGVMKPPKIKPLNAASALATRYQISAHTFAATVRTKKTAADIATGIVVPPRIIGPVGGCLLILIGVGVIVVIIRSARFHSAVNAAFGHFEIEVV